MAMIGYIRVSREDQRADLQRDALESAGCARIFEDLGVSGSKASRPRLDAAMVFLREGDVFTCWRLDRAGRSTLNVLELLRTLEDRKIGVRSLTEGVDLGRRAVLAVQVEEAGALVTFSSGPPP